MSVVLFILDQVYKKKTLSNPMTYFGICTVHFFQCYLKIWRHFCYKALVRTFFKFLRIHRLIDHMYKVECTEHKEILT